MSFDTLNKHRESDAFYCLSFIVRRSLYDNTSTILIQVFTISVCFFQPTETTFYKIESMAWHMEFG
ncbi:MAG: hypothetical protein ACJ71H_16755, partial [Nitrososphaeraceae archaeon]